MYLVIYQDNWADEIDVAGSMLFEIEDWVELVDLVAKHFEEGNTLENGIGTNESIEYDSFNNWYECYTVIYLTEEQTSCLIQLQEKHYDFKSASEEQFFYPVEQVYPVEEEK